MNILDDQFPIFRKPGSNSRPVTHSVPLLLVLKAKAEVILVVASKQAGFSIMRALDASLLAPILYTRPTLVCWSKGGDGGDDDEEHDDDEEDGDDDDDEGE